jgi:hypothetical protein
MTRTRVLPPMNGSVSRAIRTAHSDSFDAAFTGESNHES